MINDFKFVQATELDEALDVLSGKDTVCPVNGGTNVLVNLKRAPLQVDTVLDLSRLEFLRTIHTEEDKIRLGAGVPFADLFSWSRTSAAADLFFPMCKYFAGPLIRNLATVGGNICDGSPASDISPVLLALDADVLLASKSRDVRAVPISNFFKGVRKTDLKSDELLTYVEFKEPSNEKFYYYKLGKRKADAISIISVAISIRILGGIVENARVALGSVGATPLRAKNAERVLEQSALDSKAIETAAVAAAEDSSPIDDYRASADYRFRMVELLVKRGLREISGETV